MDMILSRRIVGTGTHFEQLAMTSFPSEARCPHCTQGFPGGFLTSRETIVCKRCGSTLRCKSASLAQHVMLVGLMLIMTVIACVLLWISPLPTYLVAGVSPLVGILFHGLLSHVTQPYYCMESRGMYCKNCGYQLSDSQTCCPECGNLVAGDM